MALVWDRTHAPYSDLTIQTAEQVGGDEASLELLHLLGQRIQSVAGEQERFREWCNRADALYYAEDFTAGGADLWADDPSASIPGRSHVSVNTPATYVDVPAAMQAVEPIENMLATDTTKEARTAAAALERIYTAWKREEKFDLKFHKAAHVKSLYGRTAARVYWDKDADGGPRPCAEIIEQPRNLYLGYRSDEYYDLEWAAYVTRMEPNTVAEEFGVDVQARDIGGTIIPYVQIYSLMARPSRSWLNFGPARVEVWDYWYRKPVWKGDKFVRMETWNVVLAGNAIVRGPIKYPEYEGSIPYVPLFNTFLPGQPNGRPELYDVEPLIREKYERITSGSQMIHSGVAGDYWQLTGPEAPSRVPASVKPKRNEVVAPGAGNRIETITPFMAEFQLEQYLGRIDREMATVSGLNDLLLGLAPSQVLSSSKAINALISNYESRLSMRRALFYTWRRAVWELVVQVWIKKDKRISDIVANGGGRLDIVDPSLSPRDEMETAQRAINLTDHKIWSQRRAMDATGVDDPETEQDMIREERTDATMFPAEVLVMAQLLQSISAIGAQPPPGVQGQAGQQAGSVQNDLRTALGAPVNGTSSQLPGDQGITPPEAQTPGPGGLPPGAPFARAPQTGEVQGKISQGPGGSLTPTSRILTSRNLGGR